MIVFSPQVLWKHNKDNTRFNSFYTKGLKGLGYDIPEVKGDRIKTKNHLSNKLSIIFQEKKSNFNEIENFQATLLKRSELYRKFDFQIQESGEA